MKIGPGETRNMTSPSYPENYPRCAFSFNTIEAPIGCRLKYHVLDHNIASGDTLCISERKIAVNTEICDVIEIGAIRTFSGNFASLWFSSGLSSTWKGFFVSFTSVGETGKKTVSDSEFKAFFEMSFPSQTLLLVINTSCTLFFYV